MTKFTQNWFSQHIVNWSNWLLPFKYRDVHGLEIGSFEGASACWLLDNIFTSKQSTLTCIDPWQREWYNKEWPVESEERFDRNTAKYNNLIKIKGRSQEILPQLLTQKKKYVLVYVDGDHHANSVLTDGCLSWLLLESGGLLIFDDYHWTNPTVQTPPKPAINSFLKCFTNEIAHTIKKNGQVAVWKK